MDMRDFGLRLKAAMGNVDELRPFVCEGDPRTCAAFVVGINPATSMSGFLEFWTDETGFNKVNWLTAYRNARAFSPGDGQRQQRPPKAGVALQCRATGSYPRDKSIQLGHAEGI
jgi:hypothetical protein